MNQKLKTKNHSKVHLIIITLAILVIIGLVMYILIDKEILNISINLKDKKPVISKIKEVVFKNSNNISDQNTNSQNKSLEASSYGHGDLAYINEGEIYLMDYKGLNNEKITNTNGLVTNFFISPDNRKIIFTIGEKIDMSEEYLKYYEELKSQNRSQITLKNHVYNTALFEIDLNTKKIVEILGKLDSEQYMADMLQGAVEETNQFYTGINLLGYDRTGKYIVYARDNIIRYNHLTKNFTKSDYATYIYDVNTKKSTLINGAYYSKLAVWSKIMTI